MNIQKLVKLVEVQIVVVLIMLHVWFVPKFNIFFAGAIFGIIVISWILHKDRLSDDLGLWHVNGDIFPIVMKYAIDGVVVLFFLGLLFNQSFPLTISLIPKFFWSALGYFFWALLQQLVLNGFVANRVNRAIENPEAACVVSAVLFAAIHTPNPVLMITTLIGGSISTYIYLTQLSKNMYILAIGHALIAASIKYFLPWSWHRNFNIGPNFF